MRTGPPLFAVCALLCACEPAAPDVLREFPAPRPAGAPKAATGPSNYSLIGPGEVTVTVRLDRVPLTSSLQIREAKLRVDAFALSRTTGVLEFNTLDLRAQPPSTPAQQAILSAALETDRQVPTSVHQGSFRLLELRGLSAPNAHSGKLLSSKGTSTRRVQAVARGLLELHGFRVEQEFAVNLDFSYDDASEDFTPVALTVSTRRNQKVPLGRHRITARRPDVANPQPTSSPTDDESVPTNTQVEYQPHHLKNIATVKFRLELGRSALRATLD